MKKLLLFTSLLLALLCLFSCDIKKTEKDTDLSASDTNQTDNSTTDTNQTDNSMANTDQTDSSTAGTDQTDTTQSSAPEGLIIDSFEEYLDYCGFDESINYTEFEKWIESISYGGKSMLDMHGIADGEYCSETFGGNDIGYFSVAGRQYDTHQSVSWDFSTRGMQEGLTMPFGISFSHNLTDVLNILGANAISTLPTKDNPITIWQNEVGVLTLSAVESSTVAQLSLNYSESYLFTFNNGTECSLTRRVGFLFDAETQNMVEFDIYLYEEYPIG